MKKQYTSEDKRVQLITSDTTYNYSIYLDLDPVPVGEAYFGDLDLEPIISFPEGVVLVIEDIQLILKTVHEANEDINVKDRHLQTLKYYQSWRVGDETKRQPAPNVLSDAMQWAIEKLENDDI